MFDAAVAEAGDGYMGAEFSFIPFDVYCREAVVDFALEAANRVLRLDADPENPGGAARREDPGALQAAVNGGMADRRQRLFDIYGHPSIHVADKLEREMNLLDGDVANPSQAGTHAVNGLANISWDFESDKESLLHFSRHVQV